ncbi:MAG: phosphohydrolase [Candidatus Hydrogenedentota bacterium]|nr:MAG: phosphohydrolase [Candidatus Hydrogenedentota bacterium]
MYKFKNIVTDDSAITRILGSPHPIAANKHLDMLDKHSKTFIARSPFVLVGSSDNDGNFDISPKGDPAGFVAVLDDHTLVIPERPGNKRADTFHNVLKNPAVGLIFMIPGHKETLRVSGKALIIQDEDILSRLAVKGKVPKLGIAIDVTEVFFHCAKCIVRSKLWKPEEWPTLKGIPTIAEAISDNSNTKIPKAILHAAVVADEKLNLY